MRLPHIITTTALMDIFVIGSSKSPSQPTNQQMQERLADESARNYNQYPGFCQPVASRLLKSI